MAWWLHFKFCAPQIVSAETECDNCRVAGTKKKRSDFHLAVQRVARQVLPANSHQVAFWPYESDPCLAGGRLLHVGNTAKVGNWRPAVARTHR